ncbi:MAG TPA: hypothetical protein VMU45_08620 [Candidatus Eisenbacteria bacterium]|nr:hypothetical protein [Candidatus Eisenbacteria bacterium]
MVLGMSLSTFTLLHVIISLAGLGSGFVVLFGLLNSKRLDGWTAIFLTTTVLTSVTGFMFPFEGLKPSYILAAMSLVVLAIAIWARYGARLSGAWRGTYVVTAAIALYFNCFVAVVQAFAKIPALHALAPTQTEAPFAIAQFLVLAIFVWLTYRATKRFHVAPMRTT